MRSLLRSRLRPALVAVATAAALTGCMKVDYQITLHDDETVDVDAVVALDASTLGSLAGMTGDTSLGDLANLSDDDLRDQLFNGEDPCTSSDGLGFQEAEVESEPYHDGDYVGYRCRITGASLDDLTTAMSQSADGGSATIGHDGDTWEVSLPLQMSGSLDGMDTSDPLAQQMLSSFEIRFAVTAPGKVVEQNGTKVDGSTVIWEIDMSDPPASLEARWEPGSSGGGGGSSVLWIVLALVLLAVVIGAVVLMRRRSGHGGPGSGGLTPAVPTGPVAPGSVPPGPVAPGPAPAPPAEPPAPTWAPPPPPPAPGS